MPGRNIEINRETQIPPSEIQWEFSSSSGPGGQHVNKTSTRVTLVFDVNHSDALSDEQKIKIQSKLKRFIDKNGVMRINVEQERSQHKNREIALKRFAGLIDTALKPEKIRKPTQLPEKVDQERLKQKRQRSRLKQQRQTPDTSDDW